MAKTTEKKVVCEPVVSSSDETAGLKEQIDALYKKFNMLLKVCERHFGADLDKDGFIGEPPKTEEVK